jgi:hypothetical protein
MSRQAKRFTLLSASIVLTTFSVQAEAQAQQPQRPGNVSLLL